MSKNCPFCKKSVSFSAEKCPYCNMVLVEKLSRNNAQGVNQDNIHRSHVGEIWLNFVKTIMNYFHSLKFYRLKSLIGGDVDMLKKIAVVLAVCFFIYGLLEKNKRVPASNQPNVATLNSLPTFFKKENSSVQVKLPLVSLGSGSILLRDLNYLNGHGKLSISNGTNKDAVAKLVNVLSGKSVTTVYIKAHDTYTISNISDGDYRLIFSLGLNWSSLSNKFLQNVSYEEFEDTFSFLTKTYIEGEYEKTNYIYFEITLNSVLNGDARTLDIDSGLFDSY